MTLKEIRKKAQARRAKQQAAINKKLVSSDAYLDLVNLEEDTKVVSEKLDIAKLIIEEYNKHAQKDEQARIYWQFGYSTIIDKLATLITTSLYSKMAIRPQLRELTDPLGEVLMEQVANAFPRMPYFTSAMLVDYPTLADVKSHLAEVYSKPNAKEINRVTSIVGSEFGYIIPEVSQERCNRLYSTRMTEQLAIAEKTIATQAVVAQAGNPLVI